MTVTFDPQSLSDRVRKAVMQEVIRGTEDIRNEAISLILHTEKTGRVYRRHSVEHQASAPGEAPASDTGRLINSITTEYDFQNMTGTINVGVAYGLFLEYGTKNIDPRPFLRPALANKGPAMEAAIATALRKGLSE